MKSRLGGLSEEELWGRRESLLGSRFKQRKDKLETITKDNRRIYVKINSQKSLYSSKEMNKSFESSSQLSRNLSRSRISNRQAQLATPRSRLIRLNPPPAPSKLQSVPVNRVERAEVQRYLDIFCNHAIINCHPPTKPLKKQLLLPLSQGKENLREVASARLGLIEEVGRRGAKTNLLSPRLL
jgi:hypothetical protein